MSHPRWNRGGTHEVGQVWAYREKVFEPSSPIVPAEILQFGPARSQKLKVRMQDGEFAGLEMWVLRRRLVAHWDIAAAWVRDELRYDEAVIASADADDREHAAAEIVAGADDQAGIDVGWGNPDHAVLRLADLAATADLLGLDAAELLREPHAFIDREGDYVAPWPVAVRVVQRMAAQFPQRVLEYMGKEERRLHEEAVRGRWYEHRGEKPWYAPPERCAEYLAERQPVFNLVRSWCGEGATSSFDALGALRDEVERLRQLVDDAAQALERHELKYEARQVRRKLDERNA